MKLKKDWSLAYFLYYMTRITVVMTLLFLVTILFMYLQTGSELIVVIPQTDPMVQIKNLDIDSNQLQSNTSNFIMPMLLYSRVSIMNLEGEFGQYNAKIYVARLFKFTTLLIFLVLLSRIFKSVVDKNPFDQQNPTRLFKMGGLIIGFSLFDGLLSYTISSALNDIGFSSELEFQPVFSFDQYFYIGLILILLGYVFKEGARIHEEQKLTV